jgi:polyisoprenoid-binding protein YceI
MRARYLLLLLPLWAIGEPAQAATPCRVDQANSSIRFTAWQIFGLPLSGRFKTFEAKLFLDGERPERSTAVAAVDTRSVDTGNPESDEFIESEPMLDSANHPTAVLASSVFDPGDGGAMVVKAELTMKAIRRPLVIPFRYSLTKAADGSQRVSADGEFELKRKEFNIGTGVWSNSFLFHDNIAIAVHLEMICG